MGTFSVVFKSATQSTENPLPTFTFAEGCTPSFDDREDDDGAFTVATFSADAVDRGLVCADGQPVDRYYLRRLGAVERSFSNMYSSRASYLKRLLENNGFVMRESVEQFKQRFPMFDNSEEYYNALLKDALFYADIHIVHEGKTVLLSIKGVPYDPQEIGATDAIEASGVPKISYFRRYESLRRRRQRIEERE